MLKKIMFKTDLPFRFVKLGPEILYLSYLFLAEKWLFVLFVCFVAIISLILTYFKKIVTLIKLTRKKLFDVPSRYGLLAWNA